MRCGLNSYGSGMVHIDSVLHRANVGPNIFYHGAIVVLC